MMKNTLHLFTTIFIFLLPHLFFAQEGPVGWASQNGGTTGGAGGQTVVVSTRANLIKYLEGSTPYIIFVDGTIDLELYEQLIIGSNKSLIGMEQDARIRYGGFAVRGNNVIIQNLAIVDSYDGDWEGETHGTDALTIYGQNVWVDHCHLSAAADGLLDITGNPGESSADFITVSWTRFTKHNKVMLIGSWDNDPASRGHLNTTIYNCWFDGTGERVVNNRMPRVRFGKVHVLNNYYENVGHYCASARVEGEVMVENNYFRNCSDPHTIGDFGLGIKDPELVARGNIYEVTDDTRTTNGDAFEPSDYYNFTALDPKAVPAVVMNGAGIKNRSGNEAPTAVDDEIYLDKNGDLSVEADVLANDTDTDGGDLRLTVILNQPKGKVYIKNNRIHYEADFSPLQEDVVEYQIVDTQGGVSTAKARFFFEPPSDDGDSGSGGGTGSDFADGPIGWASLNGGTWGGYGGDTVVARSRADLIKYLEGNTPYVIVVNRTIDLELYEQLIIGSNKTLVGKGNNGKIRYGGFAVRGNNVIIQNLAIVDSYDGDWEGETHGTDALTIYGQNVWVDHCLLSAAADGLLDITGNPGESSADFITVSWTRFTKHNKVMLIGSWDNDPAARGHLNTTIYNCWFDGTGERVVNNRMPRVRFGKVHVVNNFYENVGHYCASARVEGEVMVENNFFRNCSDPHTIGDFGLGQKDPELVARGNFYEISDDTRTTNGDAFEPSDYYSFTTLDVKEVPGIVMNGAGLYDSPNNKAPVAVDDEISLDENNLSFELDVTANDTDADGGDLRVAVILNTPKGSVYIKNNRIFYEADFSPLQEDVIEYQLVDTQGGVATGRVVVKFGQSGDDNNGGGSNDGTGFANGPMGWASLNGGTWGGFGGDTVVARSRADLLRYLEGSTSYVIVVDGTIDLELYEQLIIGSNKTLVGKGNSGKIRYGGFAVRGNNVIIQNLAIVDSYDGDWEGETHGTDALTIYGKNVWVDHCYLSAAADGLLDITGNPGESSADFITVSWTRFTKHNKVMLIGSWDNDPAARGHLNTTIYNCWFDGTGERVVNNRMPRVRFGKVHVVNNFYENVGHYCASARVEGEVMVENNFFRNCSDPHTIGDFGLGQKDPELVARGNFYEISDDTRTTNGDAFEPSQYYDFTALTVKEVPGIVMNGAGLYDSPNNKAPVAVDDEISLDENNLSFELDVTANDTDADGGDLRVAVILNTPKGSVYIKNNRIFYEADFSPLQEDVIEYQLVDTQGGVATGRVVVKFGQSGDDNNGGGSNDGTGFANGPMGWASLNGGTWGGFGGDTVVARSRADLLRYLEGSTSYVIVVDGTIDLELYEQLIIGSNKTLVGKGNSGKIRYGGFAVRGNNVIIQNLAIVDSYDGDWEGETHGTDALTIYGKNVWVDHCYLSAAADGLLDITGNPGESSADFITVSWTRFTKHNKVMLIGSWDNDPAARGHLNTTIYNCWFDGTGERVVNNRMPRVRFGKVHVVNNFYENVGHYCASARVEGEVMVENNFFRNCSDPHTIGDFGLGQKDPELVARGNFYEISDDTRTTNGDAFEPSQYYDFTALAVKEVPGRVMNGAGLFDDPNNQAPNAVDDELLLENGNTSAILNVAANDDDPDGGDLRIAVILNEPLGKVYIKNNVLYYEADFSPLRTDTIYYQLVDTQGGEDTGMVVVNFDSDGGSNNGDGFLNGPMGWASLNGGTWGGFGGDTVVARKRADLIKYLGGSDSYVIKVKGTIELELYEQLIIGSNKTLVGEGTNARIRYGGFAVRGNNVIIQNLSIVDSYDGDWEGDSHGTDALTIYGQNVWIDHCYLAAAADGLLDITGNPGESSADYITVSWTRFSDHNKVMLIGSWDDNETDRGHLKTTIHNCWFDGRRKKGINSRMPRVRFGDVHVLNNYYENVDQYCVSARVEGDIMVENNYFRNCSDPHTIDDFGMGIADPELVAAGNVYEASGDTRATNGDAFEPGDFYDYNPWEVYDVPAVVMNGAGPFNRANNEAPTAVDDLVFVHTENGLSAKFKVTANDTDNDGGSLRLARVLNQPKGEAYVKNNKIFYDAQFWPLERDTIYYQLVDTQGGVDTGMVMVEFALPDEDPYVGREMRIYPNPATTHAFIEYQPMASLGDVEILLYDSAGKQCNNGLVREEGFVGDGFFQYSLDTSRLLSGVFIVVIKQGKHRRIGQLIVAGTQGDD